MVSAFFILTIYLVFVEQNMFRRKDPALARRLFSFSPAWVGISVLLAVLFFAATNRHAGVLFLVLTLCFLPKYFFQRKKFLAEAGLLDFAVTEDASARRLLVASDAIGVLTAWFLGILFISFAIKAVTFLTGLEISELAEMVWLGVFSFLMILRLIQKACQRFSSEGFWVNVGFDTSVRRSWFSVYLGPALLGLLFAVVSAVIIVSRDVQPMTPLGEILGTTQSSWALAGFIFLGVMAAPLIEEIIFRGYFFRVLDELKGRMFAVSVISIVFGVLHYNQYWGDWSALVIVTVLGFALTLTRSISGTTLASTVLHYSYNIGVTLIPILLLLSMNNPYYKYLVYYETYDVATRETLLLESLQNNPNLNEAKNDLAWLYAEEKVQLDKAMTLIKEALTSDPDNVMYLDTKAEVLYQSGRYDEAVRLRQQLLSLKTTSTGMKDFLRQRLTEMQETTSPVSSH